MDSKDFIASLRKPDDSPEVSRLLNALAVTKKLKMPKDDIEARVSLPKNGVTLIFKPEGPKSSRLVLAAVQFYSDAEKGYTIFPGALPDKLSFSDKQADVIRKLGKPTESKKAFRLDRWRYKDTVWTIKYAKDDGRIGVITVHAPEYY